VHKAFSEVEAAHEAWMAIVAERVRDSAGALESERVLSAALWRLSTATSSYALRREAAQATDEMSDVTFVLVMPDESYEQAFERVASVFSEAYDETMQIAVEIVEPTVLAGAGLPLGRPLCTTAEVLAQAEGDRSRWRHVGLVTIRRDLYCHPTASRHEEHDDGQSEEQ